MYRGLHFKIILIFVVFTVVLMAAVGSVMILGSYTYYNDSFVSTMNTAFSDDGELIGALTDALSQEDYASRQGDILRSYSGALGIGDYRNYYVLDGQGRFLVGSDAVLGPSLEITPNIVSAMAHNGGTAQNKWADYIDYAVYLTDGTNESIVYVRDSQQQARAFGRMVLRITAQTLVIGMAIAIVLAFFLSKAITSPIRSLTAMAKQIAAGDYSENADVNSNDELGTLSDTINNMKDVIKTTIDQKTSEQRKFETLFVYLNDAVVVFDKYGELMHINRMARKTFGMPKRGYNEDMQGFNLSAMLARLGLDYMTVTEKYKDERNCVISDIIYDGKALDVTFAEFRYSEDKANRGIMCVIHDNTDRYELDKSRREFVSDVSHELRTPLTAIQGAVETMQEYPDLPQEMRTNLLGMADEECKRMSRIVGDLLVLSRLDNKRTAWKIETFDTCDFLDHVFEVMSVDAKNHGHTLSRGYPDDLPSLTGDKEKLQQVIVNIVSNSIKYTPDGGRIAIDAKPTESGIVICVADNGSGIPEKDIPRLFERFYRVDKARTSDAGGSGLGLAIVKEIVDAHGGNVWVQSVLNEGTKMYVYLPYRTSLTDADAASLTKTDI